MVFCPDSSVPDNSSTGIEKLKLSIEDRTRIEVLSIQLANEFQALSGKTTQECFTGSLDDSSLAHSFLFSKAVSEQDQNKRKDLGLAHLALDLEENRELKIQSPYGDSVGKAGLPLKNIYPGVYHIEQMIPDGVELAKGHQGEKLEMTTAEIADELIKFTEYYLEIYKALERRQLPVEINRGEMAAVMATQRLSIEYFGLPNEHSSARNIVRYVGKKAKLSDFKGQNSAVCTEFGALAQQSLSFAGVKTRFVSGGPMSVGDDEGNFDNEAIGGHAYNVLSAKDDGSKTFIYDPSNPLLIRNESDPTLYAVRAYLAPLSDEAYKGFISGQDTYVSYAGTQRIYSRA